METNQKKIAKWITRSVPAATYTLHCELRGGVKSRGKYLGGYEYWPDSWKSGETADRIASDLERKARDAGYKIVK